MAVKSLEQIYDHFATTYDESRGLFDISDVMTDFTSRLPVRPGHLLDLGCGAGEPFARFFVDRGWQVTGVDFSGRMLALANRYVPEMKTLHADMRQVSFGRERFDAIAAIYCLFHVPREDHAALLGRCFSWLVDGGKMLFTYATRDYTGRDEFEGYKEFLGEELFYSHKTPEALHEDLTAAGFCVESESNRTIAGETFLWVTVSKPPACAPPGCF